MAFDKDFDDWKASKDEFQGYVKGALESIHSEIKEMKDCHLACKKETNESIALVAKSADRANSRVSGLQNKMFGIAIVAGVAAHFIVEVLSRVKGVF